MGDAEGAPLCTSRPETTLTVLLSVAGCDAVQGDQYPTQYVQHSVIPGSERLHSIHAQSGSRK